MRIVPTGGLRSSSIDGLKKLAPGAGFRSIDNSALDIIESFQRNLVKHGKILIVVGASEHPLRQMRRLGLAQRLGKYMCPDMETAIQLAREAIYKKEEPNPNPREEIRIVEHK